MFGKQICAFLFRFLILATYEFSGTYQREVLMRHTTQDSAELPEPTVNLEILLDLYGAYGKYSTQSFEYVNWQHHHVDEPYFLNKYHFYHPALMDVRCSVDYVRCITNLEIPAPVCAMVHRVSYYHYRLKYFESYCHVYLENCLLRHRRYRMLNYGGCEIDQKGFSFKKWEYPKEHPLRRK